MKRIIFLIFLWLVFSCAPLKEEGGFKTPSIQVSSQVKAPPNQSSNPTPPPKDTNSNDKDKDNEEEKEEEEEEEEEEKKEDPQGEEFKDGSETEEVGPPPITRNL